jgi:hypothetical protein
MPGEPIDESDSVRAFIAQGASLYLKTLVALRHFNAKVYEDCHAVLTRNLTMLGSSIGVGDLASKRIRPHLFPSIDPEAVDWDGTEAFIGAKIQIASYAPLILYFYLGIEEEVPAWWTGISLGFTSLARRTATLKQLQKKKDSLADESAGSYGTDSWLLDFSRKKPLTDIDSFPGTLEEVVNEWFENCQSVGGIKLGD